MTFLVPLHLVDWSHSLLQRVSKLRSWKVQPKMSGSQIEPQFSPTKSPCFLTPQTSLSERNRAKLLAYREPGCQAELLLCLSGCISLLSPSSCVYWSFSPLNLLQSHSVNQHTQSTLHIFTRFTSNVLSHRHIFIFSCADARGGPFQILLRDAYWGVIDVAAVLLAPGQYCSTQQGEQWLCSTKWAQTAFLCHYKAVIQHNINPYNKRVHLQGVVVQGLILFYL